MMLVGIAIKALPILLAVTLHEVAHGWAAKRLGDPTAAARGRLSLNPLVHVDPVGTVLFPALQVLFTGSVFFGWAKPVPVDPRYFRDPRRDMMWVALAGPAANLVQALVAGLLIHVMLLLEPSLPAMVHGSLAPSSLAGVLAPLWLMCLFAVIVNVALMVFNLLPVPPLDGSRVAYALLPRRAALAYSQLERWGLLIVMGIVILIPGLIGMVLWPAISGMLWLLQIPVQWLTLLP